MLENAQSELQETKHFMMRRKEKKENRLVEVAKLELLER